MPNYVPGYGPKDSPVILVGEAPGETEDRYQIPFCGRAGKFLAEEIKEATGGHFKIEDCYRTNVVKHRPPDNKLKRLHEIGHSIEEYLPQLWHELGDIPARVVVPLGNLALHTVTGKGTGKKGIMDWRGSILKTQHLDKTAIPTLHPSALLRAQSGNDGSKGGLDQRFRYVFRLDLHRAFKDSFQPRHSVPDPHLEVIRDHVALLRFLERYKDKKVVAVDIEVVKAIPICIGLAFNDWHGASIPLLDVMSWSNLEGIPEGELVRMWQILAAFLARTDLTVVGQNFKFDHNALYHICKMKILGKIVDIMFYAHSLYPEFEKRLSFHTSLWTRHPFYKTDGRQYKVGGKESIIKFLQYNARDCVVTFELYERFLEQAKAIQIPEFTDWHKEFIDGYVLGLHDFYRRLESVGLRTIKSRQRELVREYLDKLGALDSELRSLSGIPREFNLNSNTQIKRLLYKKQDAEGGYPFSFGLPHRDAADEDTLIALAANSCKNQTQRQFISRLLDYRRTRKSIGTYFAARSDYDGRMRTSFTICGTETGRSSTRILKPPVRPKKIGLAFHTLTKHGDIGPEIRSILEADDGYKIVETDMSQAEARIVARLGNDANTLDLFRRKADIHTLTASWIFGIPPEQVTKELRFVGKTTRHAGNYGMGKNRLMHIVNTDAKKFKINIHISEWKAGIILDKFHKFAPAIRGGFHVAVQEALRDNNRVLVNPYGRRRQFFGEWGESLFKEAYAQIPQSTVPDHLRHAGLRVEERFRQAGKYHLMTEYESIYCIEAHDALIAHIKAEYVDEYIKVIEEEIEKPIDFSRCTIRRDEVVIPAETKVGDSYKECNIKGCPGCKYLHSYVRPTAVAA